MTSKRDIERRIEALAAANEIEPVAPWMEAVPKELWDDKLAAWRYWITEGESHPHLDTET